MKTIILNTDSLLNPGDAAIVLAQIRLLRRLRPGLEVSLTSRTPDLDRAFYGRLGVTVLEPLLPALSLWRGFGSKLAGCVRRAADVAGKSRLIREIRSSAFVVSCGGGPFYSNRRRFPGPTFAQNVLHVRLAQALGKPVVFFPQSFGPFASPAAERTVARLLAHPRTARILVREPDSAALLSRILPASARAAVAACPDMVFSLRPERGARGDARLEALPAPRLVLSVRGWDFPEADTRPGKEDLRSRYLDAVSQAAVGFQRERGGSVAVVPHTRGPGDFEDDRIVSRKLASRLGRVLPPGRLAFLDIPDAASPEDMIALYAGADLILATRTHAAVFGLLAGRPIVSIHYQPKGAGLMAALGLESRTLPIAEVDGPHLLRLMDQAARRPASEAVRVAGRIGELGAEIEVRLASVLDEVAPRR